MSRGVYRAIYSALYDDPDFQLLTPHARHTLTTARGCKEAGAAAIFRCYPEMLAVYTGWPIDVVGAALDELEQRLWIMRENGVLWIRNGLRHDPTIRLSNRKHLRSVVRCLQALPRCRLVQHFCEYYRIDPDLVGEWPDAKPRDKCPPWLRRAVLIAFGRRCQYCRATGTDVHGPDGLNWEVDRVVSGASGGEYVPANVTLSCQRCNVSKGSRTVQVAVQTLADVTKSEAMPKLARDGAPRPKHGTETETDVRASEVPSVLPAVTDATAGQGPAPARASARVRRPAAPSKPAATGPHEAQARPADAPEGSDRPPGPGKAPRRPHAVQDPEIREAVKHWEDGFARKMDGEKPVILWARSCGQLAPIVRSRGLARTRALLDAFFASQDRFIVGSDYSLGAFLGNIHRLIVADHRGTTNGHVNGAGPPAGDRLARMRSSGDAAGARLREMEGRT